MKVFVSIVTFNNADVIQRCLDGALSQNGFEPGKTLHVALVDNNSTDGTLALIDSLYAGRVLTQQSSANLGFCAGNNLLVAQFLESDCDYLLLLNPDLYLEKDALRIMTGKLANSPEIGCVCPRLLRADSQLNPVSPRVLDACGMELTTSLRHLDRGSGELEAGRYLNDEPVFGGSGACLLLKREMVKDCLLQSANDTDFGLVYPELLSGLSQRAALFDEAFFAYREDADLAWRAQLLGWKCLYVANAVGYHRRTVLPENRKNLPSLLNMLGVRNRFLLQLNNYSFKRFPEAFLPGIIVRNLIVIFAVLLVERSSLRAFGDLRKLYKRAFARRAILLERIKNRERESGNVGELRQC